MKELCLPNLVDWFHLNKRPLPWRENPSPYSVWVSEVMLQQTQAANVIPYYLHFMRHFPTIQALSQAPYEEVLKCWEGLGYYSRIRNLHSGARLVVEKFGGSLPRDAQALHEIKGLGPYTVNAILAFAFHERAAPVDGNVTRVLTRIFNIHHDVCKTATKKQIQQLADGLLPETKPWVVAEALIELGATLCSKAPECSLCPVVNGCIGHRAGSAKALPYKGRKNPITQLVRDVFLLCHEDHWLLKRGQPRCIMADLYEFPYLNADDDTKSLATTVSETFGLQALFQESLPPVTHSFTRYHALLRPHLFQVKKRVEVPRHTWHASSTLQGLPFSSGHRRIMKELSHAYLTH